VSGVGVIPAEATVGKTREWLLSIRRPLIIFLGFFLIAYLVHGIGQNLVRNLLGGGDGYTAGLPSKLFSTTLSAWNPYVQLGQYTFANTQFQPFYPPGLILLALFPNTFGYNLFILGHYALAGFFFYLFARNLSLSKYASFAGGICFMCSGFLVAHKGHQAMMSTAVWLPLMLCSIDRYARVRKLSDIALGAVAIAMSILGGFPQITVYSLMIAMPYLIFRCSRSHSLSMTHRIGMTAAGMVSMAVLAFLLASLQLFAVAETLPHITRQAISLSMFSEDALPAYHYLTLLIPNALGGFHGIPTYSQNLNVVEMYTYMGILPLALAIFILRDRVGSTADIFFWAGVVLAAGTLAVGLAPVQRLLHAVPVYNLFRAPARHLFEVNFGIAVLAAYGIDRLCSTGASLSRRTIVALRFACFVTAAFFLSVLALTRVVHRVAEAAGSYLPRVSDIPVSPIMSVETLRAVLLTSLDLNHPTILYPIIFTSASLLWLLAARWRPNRSAVKLILPVLIVADIASVYRTIYDNPDTTALYHARMRPEVSALLASGFDRDHYRIFPIDPALGRTYPLQNMMYELSAVNDYTPMWLRRYQEIAEFALNGAGGFALLARNNLLSSIGAQYLLTREPAIAAQIAGTPAQRPLPADPLPLPPIDCPALNCVLTTFPSADSMALRSHDGEAVAIVHFPVSVERSTFYQIQFEARTNQQPAKPLVVDMYSSEPGKPSYDDPSQDRIVQRFPMEFSKYTLLINSGASAPNRALVRFYTQSDTIIEIRRVVLSKVKSTPAPAYVLAHQTPDNIWIFKNPGAVPRFRFATRLRPAADLQAARQILVEDSSFDPAQEAIVEKLSGPMQIDSGRIVSERLGNNHLRFEVETGRRSFLVVADSWFPGWRATVDGREAEMHIVNGFIRGIFVEGAGRHSVEMRFWPRSLTMGLTTTLVGFVIAAVLACTRIQFPFSRRSIRT
jgi:hypothetical protein